MCEKVEKYGDEREEEGRIAGKEEAQIKIAKKLIELGKLSLEDIAACTGLPLSKRLISRFVDLVPQLGH